MPPALPTRVRKLYRDGWSERAIASQFNIKISTIIRLLDKNKFSNRSLSYIKRYERQRKKIMNSDSVKISKISEDDARLFASLLYWCEGAKYPASTAMNFTTTDLKMQKMFISLFRKGFNPIESKFKIWLQFHNGQDKQKIFRYWATNLKIPISQFMKPSVTERKGGRYRKVYYGTCSLRYGGYSTTLRMMGIYQKFYKQALSLLV